MDFDLGRSCMEGESSGFQNRESAGKVSGTIRTTQPAIIMTPKRDACCCVWSDNDVAFTVDYWELNAQEQVDFQHLHHRISDVKHWMNSPDVVVRYLKARPGKVHEAEKMFRSMVDWRLRNDVDTILERYHPPAILLSYFPGAILQGRDRQGDPIFVGRSGSTDLAALIERFGQDELIQYSIWMRESLTTGPWIQEYEREQKRPVKRVTIVDDMHGLSRKQLTPKVLSVYGQIMKLDQENYCEVSKKIIIIRAPAIIRIAWTLAKHFFDPINVQKMEFCGSSNYKEVLRDQMELEILPSCLVHEGKGRVATGMPPRLEGGPLPPMNDGESKIHPRIPKSPVMSLTMKNSSKAFVRGKTLCTGQF